MLNNEPFLLPCPVCQSNTVVFALTAENRHGRHLQQPVGHFDLYRCMDCGALFLPNVTTDADYYRTYYPQGYHTDAEPALLARLWAPIARSCLNKRIALIQAHLRGAPRYRLLDVGCGGGGFIRGLPAHAFDAQGLEPIRETVEALQSEGLQVSCGSVYDAAPADAEQFDVITLWHVLEHLQAPALALTNLKTRLQPNGLLVISTPNTASLACRIGGRRWFHLDAPRHLVWYTPDNLSALLERHGFTVECVTYSRLDYPLDLLWSLTGSWKGRLLLPFYLFLKLYDHQNMTVIARRL